MNSFINTYAILLKKLSEMNDERSREDIQYKIANAKEKVNQCC